MGIDTIGTTAPVRTTKQRSGWFATGGMIGAILASTCCVAPLALLTVGVSGAWIGNLTALEPYKPIFAGIAIGSIAVGFRQAYFGKKVACEDGTYCARPAATLVTKSALWLATVLVIFALTINWWAPLLY